MTESKIAVVARRLLKMYNLLHPHTPFFDAESKEFAQKVGFKENSIDLEQLAMVYNTDLEVPKVREDIQPNILSQIGREFLNSLNSNQAKDYLKRYYEIVFDRGRNLMTCQLTEDDDMDWLLTSLEQLKKDEEWVIDNTGGLSMKLYARPRDSKHPPVGPYELSDLLTEVCPPFYLDESKIEPLFNHIRLPFTRRALWQVYLLYVSTNMIGLFGHGSYRQCRMVLDYSDLEYNRISDEDEDFDEFSLKENKPLLKYLLGRDIYPTIITDTTYAMITHYWINNWKGLFKTHMIVKYNQYKQNITDWYIINEEPLIQYDCDVRF